MASVRWEQHEVNGNHVAVLYGSAPDLGEREPCFLALWRTYRRALRHCLGVVRISTW